MGKIDINKYKDKVGLTDTGITGIESKTKLSLKILLKVLLTAVTVMLITGAIVFSSVLVYIMSLANDTFDYDLRATKLKLTSFIYVNDENGTPQEYQKVYNTENRVWVDFDEIPEYMRNAAIAIEDKRFLSHKGVDFVRTSGAVLNLLTGSHDSYGGSTITQQLIKNLTEDNKVSLTRKLREIFRALNFEREYSKDEILEAYLNVVNFGSGCRGVQAAANLYFSKDIKDCTIAECAAIAGITQNPSAYTPLVYPENNKARRETVLLEMYNQNMISLDQYNEALEESKNMVFKNNNLDDSNNNTENQAIRNWYIEALLNDVIEDLSTNLKIGKTTAEEMLFNQGLKIYCAMDKDAQEKAESVLKDENIMPKDKDLDLGYVMMDLDGRILATLGGRKEKTANLLYDKANQARRQPGSTIKPIAVYAPAIDLSMYNYSSLVPDKPFSNIDITGNGDFTTWPKNWYSGYRGNVTLQWAIEVSANAPAAQVLSQLTPQRSYQFLNEKLGFKSLDPRDAESLAPLSAGGTHVGVTVREMAAAFQIFGNGGNYNKPFTYFYVTDSKDNIILDNRNNIKTQAISSQTATIMNRLLRNVVTGPEGTGRAANISNWNVIGKTGTTDNDHDSWFIGVTPYSVAGIWTGYDTPKTITETSSAIKIWKQIMTKYLENKEPKDYNYDSNVVTCAYCKSTGKLANESYCGSTAIGYYSKSNLPEECDGNHSGTVQDKQNKPANNQNDKEVVNNSQAEQVTSQNSAEQKSSSSSQEKNNAQSSKRKRKKKGAAVNAQ